MYAPKKKGVARTTTQRKSTVERQGNMFWGPSYWKTIHTAAASYHPSKKASFLMFIYSLPDLLPCSLCAEHMKANLKAFPPDDWLDSRDALFTWSYRFHNLVNVSKNPPSTSPDFKQVKRYYYEGIYSCAKCNANE